MTAGRALQFVQDRAVEGLLDVAEPAGDVGAVEHTVVVDQLDDDVAVAGSIGP